MKKLFVATAALIITAGVGTSYAADDDNDGYDDITGEPVSTEETTTTTEDTSTSTTTTSTTTTAAGTSNPYTLGISVPLIGSDFSVLVVAFSDPSEPPLDVGIARAKLLWALGDNWLDLGLGLQIASRPDPAMPMDNVTSVGLVVDAGYRMMKPTKGRVMPFLKPFAELGVGDFDDAGGSMILGLGATLGVDVQIVEQFTLGAEIGAGLRTADGFDSFVFSTRTSNLNATIWW